MSERVLDGKVAVVTGAAGGMGRAICAAFVDAGARVVAGDRDATSLAGVNDVVGVVTDVSRADDIARLVGTAVDRFGRLDVAVNAAAIEFETVPLHECADDDFDRMMAVNVRSVFLSMKHEIAAMLATERGDGAGGAIVNVASTNSFRPQANQPAYTASKHAVLGLTRSAAIDYAAAGIRINAIAPGAIDTPMLRTAMERRGRNPEETARRLSRLRRFGRPDEIAAAALFLCSDAASFTTGHTLAVDGGMLAG
jgi:NAD(P)-dependent dehydrogenase (short-subunit alcohol dehydrogenase family)